MLIHSDNIQKCRENLDESTCSQFSALCNLSNVLCFAVLLYTVLKVDTMPSALAALFNPTASPPRTEEKQLRRGPL